VGAFDIDEHWSKDSEYYGVWNYYVRVMGEGYIGKHR